MSGDVRDGREGTRGNGERGEVEGGHVQSRTGIKSRAKGERKTAIVRGSDIWDAGLRAHSLTDIGARRTWIKASQPDLVGIRHALADPDLRISLAEPQQVRYPVVEKVELRAGFLDGQELEMCPDLNCLLGGTGAGKSLVLESIRFALEQQGDQIAFPAIWKAVDSRLAGALGDNGSASVTVRVKGER